MIEPTELQRFEDNRLGYLHGTLPAAEQAWMDDCLRRFPELSAELELDRRMRASLIEALPKVSPAEGLPAFMARVRADQADAERPAATAGWFDWLTSTGTGWLKPVWAAPIAIILAQAGVITHLLVERGNAPVATEYAEWRGASTPQGDGPLLRITFKPGVKEADLRFLLVRIRGEIVGGPGQLGHYYVRVPADTIDAARRSLSGDPGVEAVETVPGLPREP